jgi:hypothetical protein
MNAARGIVIQADKKEIDSCIKRIKDNNLQKQKIVVRRDHTALDKQNASSLKFL